MPNLRQRTRLRLVKHFDACSNAWTEYNRRFRGTCRPRFPRLSTQAVLAQLRRANGCKHYQPPGPAPITISNWRTVLPLLRSLAVDQQPGQSSPPLTNFEEGNSLPAAQIRVIANAGYISARQIPTAQPRRTFDAMKATQQMRLMISRYRFR
jgi:hypothetical protein